MDNLLDYETVKQFYIDEFGIDGWVVEMFANIDVLTLCASGACNETISSFLEIPVEEIKRIIRDTFDFGGWEEDLPVNPYKLLNEIPDTYYKETKFVYEMKASLRGYVEKDADEIIAKSYLISRTMREIEERIENEWV